MSTQTRRKAKPVPQERLDVWLNREILAEMDAVGVRMQRITPTRRFPPYRNEIVEFAVDFMTAWVVQGNPLFTRKDHPLKSLHTAVSVGVPTVKNIEKLCKYLNDDPHRVTKKQQRSYPSRSEAIEWAIALTFVRWEPGESIQELAKLAGHK